VDIRIEPEAFYVNAFGEDVLQRIDAAVGAADMHKEFHERTGVNSE
jgi:ribosomal protein L21E